MDVGTGLNNASALTVSGALEAISVDSTSPLQYCASAYYASGAYVEQCTTVGQTIGAVQTVQAVLPLDVTQTLASIHIHLKNSGGSSLEYLLDNASADLTLSGAAPTQPPPTPTSADITVDWSSVEQNIDGFGASNAVDNPLTTARADLFFSPSAGIGLSLLRVDMTDGQLNGGAWNDGALAVARGARIFATPWTAPAADKDNDSENGGTLLPADYDSWASAMVTYLQTYKANSGVDIYAVSVQNEPDLAEDYTSMKYSPEELAAFVAVLGPKLAAMSPRPKLIVGEYSDWHLLPALINYFENSDQTALGYTDIWGIHQYQGVESVSAIQPIWETEMSSFDDFNPSIDNAVTVATWVNDSMTTGNTTAWCFWQLVGSDSDDEGLIGHNLSSDFTKRIYAVGNFSKFVRPGWVRVDTSGSKSGIYGVTAYRKSFDRRFRHCCDQQLGFAGDVELGNFRCRDDASHTLRNLR